MINNEKNSLHFWLDAPQIEGDEGSAKELLPSSRSRFIEIVEDSDETIGFGSSIKCQSLKWEFQCPLDWSQLKRTEFEDVRFCQRCDEKVYTAYSKAELNRLIKQGACVRVNTQFDQFIMGMMGEQDYPEEENASRYLIGFIIQLSEAIEYFYKKRGYYPIVKLKRLLGRLERFELQVLKGLRPPLEQSPKDDESLNKVMELINDKSDLERKLQYGMMY
jgi:hypothetical protein